MSDNSTDQAIYRTAVYELEETRRRQLSAAMRKQRKYWKPIIHAEIILLDWFIANNLRFFGADRYIGCSKPSCYCCFHDMKEHGGQIATPACHNNADLGWHAPNIHDPIRTDRMELRHRCLNMMITKMWKEVLDHTSPKGSGSIPR